MFFSSIILAATLACTPPTLINKSSEEWNNHDKKILKRAIIVCEKQYNSCLGVFIKKETKNYHVLCK